MSHKKLKDYWQPGDIVFFKGARTYLSVAKEHRPLAMIVSRNGVMYSAFVNGELKHSIHHHCFSKMTIPWTQEQIDAEREKNAEKIRKRREKVTPS